MTYPAMSVLYAPKRTSEESEWEDAAAYDELRGVCAVSDGAGSSYRAARWSSALVEAFVTDPPSFDGAVDEFAAWVKAVGDRFQATSEAVSDATWYTSDASRRGSFATFVGVQMFPGPPIRVRALYVGDACIFHCRRGQILAASRQDPDLFDSTPDLLGSSPYQNSYGAENVRFIDFTIEVGDTILLATDALSAAMLRLSRSGKPVWETFGRVGQPEFTSLVARLREANVMEDDDVTLLRVETTGIAS